MLKLKLQYFGHVMQRTGSLGKILMLGKTEAGGEGSYKGWDGWVASVTQWTWVWANSERWWRTGKPGRLQFMRSQRVGHDLATEKWTTNNFIEEVRASLQMWLSSKISRLLKRLKLKTWKKTISRKQFLKSLHQDYFGLLNDWGTVDTSLLWEKDYIMVSLTYAVPSKCINGNSKPPGIGYFSRGIRWGHRTEYNILR